MVRLYKIHTHLTTSFVAMSSAVAAVKLVVSQVHDWLLTNGNYLPK